MVWTEGEKKKKKEELFPSIVVKADIRTSVLNAQVTHNPPAARWQLAPKSLEKLSALNRCLTIVGTFKSKSGRASSPPPTTPHPRNNSYYIPYQGSSTLLFSQKTDHDFHSFVWVLFSIIFLHLSDWEIWRKEAEFICCVLWDYFSPDWKKQEQIPRETCNYTDVKLTEVRKPFPFSRQF